MNVLKFITLSCTVGMATCSNSSAEIDLSDVIIGLSPYVSILDIYDRRRYSVDDMVPMVSKVATKFNKIFYGVDLSNLKETDSPPSFYLVGYSTAKYNCLNTTTNKIELILAIFPKPNDDCHVIAEMTQLVTKLVDEINELCDQTTQTILISSESKERLSNMADCGEMLNLTDRYTWGEIYTVGNYCNPTNIRKTDPEFVPDVVALKYDAVLDDFSINVTACQPFGENTSYTSKIIKHFGITDTRADLLMTVERYLSFWKGRLQDKNFDYIMLQAFDTFEWNDDKRLLLPSVMGWWYLLNDTGRTNTSEFVFEEKSAVASKLDKEENPSLLPWYLNKTFDKETNGIVFKSHFTQIASEQDFCKLITFQEIDDILRLVKNAKMLEKSCGKKFQLFLWVHHLTKTDLDYFRSLPNEQVTLLIQLDPHNVPLGYDKDFMDIIKSTGFQFGYYIHIDICGQYDLSALAQKRVVDNALKDTKSSINIFYYFENYDTVQLGATRMFRHRNVLFENCRTLVSSQKNQEKKFGFALTAFYRGRQFYEFNWAMKNYVRYIDILSTWAGNYNDTLVFLGQDLDRPYVDPIYRNWETVGWYSYNKFVESKGYKPTKNRTSTDSTLIKNDNIVIILVCSVLAFVLIIAIVLGYIIYRFRKKTQVSYEECKTFFDGRLDGQEESGDKDPNYIKYDKMKYEVSQRDFKVNTDELLGSGEYGKVYRGTIKPVDKEWIEVAIKTTNPQKLHRTMLNGLLSEIKLLSYLGEHKNVIKLLGANTSELRIGKIFVFLELCSSGSLKSYLQKIYTENSTALTIPKDEELETNIEYTNITCGSKRLLDASLSNDFYRWSQEICGGMEYLASKHVVHADVASRNILLDSKLVAKICDFGLSRRMYNYQSYVKSQQEPLPWKWMAPEALRFMQFNEKSDVWSFGVTLWEIYSLGSLPYAGLSWDANFVGMLEDGLVPSKPDYDKKNMYELMLSCWKILPDKRPTFSQILAILISSGN